MSRLSSVFIRDFRVSTLLVALFMLGACAEVSEYVIGEDNIKPAELSEFKQTLPVKLVWSTQLNTISGRSTVKIDPVEIDGVIYIAEPEGRVAAHKASDGSLVWEVFLEKTVSGGVGKSADAILLGTDDAEVIAIDKNTGKIQWSHKVTSEILSAPLLKDKMAITYSGDGVISAINVETGERLWANRNTVPSLSLRGTGKPLISGNSLIAGLANGKVIALDIRNGKKLWESTIAVAKGRSELQRIVDLDSDIRIADGVIYVASYQGRLAAIDESSGRIIWVRDLSSYQSLEIGNAELYLTDNQSQVWAVDRKTGATLWRQDKLKGRMLTSPVVQANYLAIGDYQGFIHWLNREDGDLAARLDMEAANISAEIAGSVTVEEFEVDDNFNFKQISGIISTPLVIGNMIYIADKGGVLAAYRIGNGV